MREEGWGRGHSVLALEGTRACWRPGGLELLLGHWSAALTSPLLGDSRNPLTRDTEAMPALLTLGPFARTVPLPMPQTGVPARGELITLVKSLVLCKERQEVPAAPHTLWCCGLFFGHALPKQGRNTEESLGLHLFAKKSLGLGTAEEGGYDPWSGRRWRAGV